MPMLENKYELGGLSYELPLKTTRRMNQRQRHVGLTLENQTDIIPQCGELGSEMFITTIIT